MMETSPPGNSRFTRQALCWKKKKKKNKDKCVRKPWFSSEAQVIYENIHVVLVFGDLTGMWLHGFIHTFKSVFRVLENKNELGSLPWNTIEWMRMKKTEHPNAHKKPFCSRNQNAAMHSLNIHYTAQSK